MAIILSSHPQNQEMVEAWLCWVARMAFCNTTFPHVTPILIQNEGIQEEFVLAPPRYMMSLTHALPDFRGLSLSTIWQLARRLITGTMRG